MGSSIKRWTFQYGKEVEKQKVKLVARGHNILFPFKFHKLKTNKKSATQKSWLPRFELLINSGYRFVSNNVNTITKTYANRINS